MGAIIPIVIKVLSALPWGSIFKGIGGLFGKKKKEPVGPGDKDPADQPTTKVTDTFSGWQAKAWMVTASSQMGIKEIRGRKHNKQILKFHASTSLKASTDEVPWCASYTGWVLETCGVPSTRSARARSYEKWGIPIEKKYGAVAVFWRSSKSSGKGHVGFYIKDDPDRPGNVLILGGNQSNMVKISSYPEDRILSYRWPLED